MAFSSKVYGGSASFDCRIGSPRREANLTDRGHIARVSHMGQSRKLPLRFRRGGSICTPKTATPEWEGSGGGRTAFLSPGECPDERRWESEAGT